MSTAATTPTPQVWRFEALDTWFFRESRPLESVGGAQLTSQFPPPARTLIGAIRTTLGDALHTNTRQTDWNEYRIDPAHPLRRHIGSPDDVAPLQFQGPYLMRQGERLYPAPLVLMQAAERFTRLRPGDTPVDCDLGRVRLPRKVDALPGARPLEGTWLTRNGLQAVLQGGTPATADLIGAAKISQPEPRLGIALDERRRPIDGLLYQTRHLRLAEDISVGITVQGLDAAQWPALAAQGVTRLGGEGRLAGWTRQAEGRLPAVTPGRQATRLMLCLLTSARFEHGWLPDGFSRDDSSGTTTWRGTLAGRPARLVCAVTGKPVREGGWDLAHQRPRELHARVAAGSCYFFEFDRPDDAQAVASACHGHQIGQDTAWGGGQVAVGLW